MSKKARRQELTELVNAASAFFHICDVRQRKPWSFCRIVFGYKDKAYTGLGFSKVCWPDKWDATRGSDLAYRKAVADIVRQIMADEEC